MARPDTGQKGPESGYPALVERSQGRRTEPGSVVSNSPRKELEFLASRTDEVDVEAGRTLIRQGTPSDTFYVVLDGEAEVEVDGKARPPLRPGSFFGEISMLDRGPATATVVARTPVRLMVMSHAQSRDAAKGNGQLLSHLFSVAARRR